MNFKEWLAEGQDTFHNPGVPSYARTDTPAIRGPFPSSGDSGLPLWMLNRTRDARRQMYDKFGVKSYRDLPGKEFVTKDGKRGVIVKTNDTKISTKIFEPKSVQMMYGKASNLEPTGPCLAACNPTVNLNT